MNKQIRWLFLIGGIFAVLAGLYMFARPLSSLASLTYVFAVIMLVNGIAEVVRYAADKASRKGILLFSGVLTILLAISLLSSPLLGLASFFPYLFALWVLANGFARLMLGLAERRNDKASGNHLLILGILGILIGAFLFGHPLFTGLMAAYMIAFGFLFQGIANCILFWKLGQQA